MHQEAAVGHATRSRHSAFQCNYAYLKSLPGILKILQVMSSLIAFICLNGTDFMGCGGCVEWFRAVGITGSLLSCIFLSVYFLQLFETSSQIPWTTIDIACCVFWMIFSLSAATNMAVTLAHCSTPSVSCDPDVRVSDIFATIFGFVAMAAYGLDAGLNLARCPGGIGAHDVNVRIQEKC